MRGAPTCRTALSEALVELRWHGSEPAHLVFGNIRAKRWAHRAVIQPCREPRADPRL